MFSYEEVLELLDELKLQKTEENIKWAYSMLVKEVKTQVKIWSYEKKYDEDFWGDYYDCGCGEDCECEDDSCCSSGGCCCSE